jgi:hypothetical protein
VSTPGMYDNAKERFIGQSGATGGAIDLLTADIRAKLIDDADYTANFATDIDLVDVPNGAEVATLSGGLGTKTVTNGVFDAADDTFTTVSGDPVESTLVYEHDAIDGNAELIVLLDNGGSTTPNGNDINIQWDSGANKIFALN